MSLTHEEVIQRWLSQDKKHGRGHSLVFSGKFLNSYNQVLGIRFEDGFCLVNGTRYSHTSSRHLSMVLKALRIDKIPHGILPFELLVEAGLTPHNILREEIIDATEDSMTDLVRVDTHSPWMVERTSVRFYPPKQGMLVLLDDTHASWHVLGGILLRNGERYFVGGIDSEYFLAELPEPVTSVTEAYESLKPLEIRGRASNEYVRQGEWFFLLTDETRESLRRRVVEQHPYRDQLDFFKKTPVSLEDFDRMVRVKALPREEGSNAHLVRQFELDGKIYCTGMVRHQVRRHRRNEVQHTPIRLGDRWAIALKSRAVRSWSMSNGID